jgi:O-antigen/teichoic acid export membrane protein
LLLPKYGYIGAAWTTLICYTLMTAISFYLGQKHFKIEYNIQSIILYFIIALCIFWISGLYSHSTYMNIQIDNTILFVLYLIFIFWQLNKVIKKKYI